MINGHILLLTEDLPPNRHEHDKEIMTRRLRSIGRALHDVPTPALVLHLDAARRNIDEMARRMDGLSAKLRPHVKVHKSPEVARMQIAAGAIGVATATVWEAVAMVDAGIQDVLVANQVVGDARMAAAAAAAARARLTVAVDDHGNLERLAAAARAAGSESASWWNSRWAMGAAARVAKRRRSASPSTPLPPAVSYCAG